MTCEYCGAPTGYVAGWKLVRANESKREAMKELAALKAENERLRDDAERWQYLVKAIRNRAEWEAVDEIFEAARIEQWKKALLDGEIDKVRQQEQGQG